MAESLGATLPNPYDIEPREKRVSYELTVKNGRGETDLDIPAVVLRNVSKHYSKGMPVLQNLNMTVKRGSIYSLLGSSGAGKTTTLSIIVGIRKVNAGNVWVLGYEPGKKGKSVGWMPQESSLYDDFSIRETLVYFGTLCGMSRNAAVKQTAFLTQMLRLPDSSQRVGTLSGGQRRRTAFAVALIHDKCFRADSTIGIDPLLRESIWKHLVQLSTERGTTVLITTHYIDEASKSCTVGIIRCGRLLVEKDPQSLLQRFNTSSLEDVVLELSRNDENENELMNGKAKGRSGEFIHKNMPVDEESPVDDSEFIPPTDSIDTSTKIADSFIRLHSLLRKNLMILFRNMLLFSFSVLIPSFIIFLMCIAFKDDPKYLNFGLVNYEEPNSTYCLNYPESVPGECDIENLSCKYIKNIKPDVYNWITFETEDEARAAVHDGTVWGYMKFQKDFSSFFYERSASGSNVDEEVLDKSEITVNMDQTTKTVVNRVKKSLHDGFEDFAKDILENCGFDKRQGEFVLQYDTPVFGTDDTKFINFVAPSVTVGWLFFFPIIAASIRHINEKKQGTFDRSLVAGTKVWEVLFAYGLTEGIVLVLQSLTVYFILRWVIGVEILGSSLQILILFVMSGFGGVSMGFFIGTLCNEEIEAALLAMALFFPNFFVSGLIWPVEGMPLVLQKIATFLPCTLTAEALRSLFTRGWPFTHLNVFPGYISLVCWMIFYFLLTVLVQKLKTK